jgi:hypothetical protein
VLKAVDSYKKDDGVLTVFTTCTVVELSLLCICRLCSPSQVVNLEVLVFICIYLVTADPYVALSCIGGAVFMVGCCPNYQ